jgi:hypothetical protein
VYAECAGGKRQEGGSSTHFPNTQRNQKEKYFMLSLNAGLQLISNLMTE